ncbi:GNAT family N-acetyltransferase [Emticicia sp. BO119]|uniref:GNAT family N-acetyltransferase n=1 Tax=Emticicia sp. BO119 TaxID=2757768 RepID=UPI00286E6888|nr:GNAT family N-acetyltransferase [Emticicia sp. BO119]
MLYLLSVRHDYTDEQLKVWASGVENVSRWQSRLAQQYVLVAEINNTIAGFCTLDKGTYLDFLYIHKDYQRHGIAYELYNVIESEARQQNQTKLTSDVSKTARPFFETMGFCVLSERTLIKHGVELNNYKMEKTLIY